MEKTDQAATTPETHPEMRKATEFLSELFGSESQNASQHQIGIFTLPAKAGGFFSCAREAVNWARKYGDSGNVYFRTCTVQRDVSALLGPGERGAAAQSSAMCAVWADIDFGGDGAKKKYPPGEAAAMDVIARLGPHLRPTVIIHSGHGLQAWWFFDEMVELGDGEGCVSVADAGGLAAGWVNLIRMHASAAGGWTVDSVGDLARVMRLPGFVNRKREPHVPVRILEADYSRRYSMRALQEEVMGAVAAETAVVAGVTDGVSVGAVDENSRADEEKKIRLFQFEPLCADSYFRKRSDKPGWSDSEYDMSLAHYAIHVGRWSDEEAAKLIIESRRRAGVLDKLFEGGKFSVRKLLLVVAKARKGKPGGGGGGGGDDGIDVTASQEAAIRNLVGLEAGGGIGTSGDGLSGRSREDALALLSQALGVDLRQITKFSGDSHSYMIETGKGRVSGLIVDDLINQGRFAKRLAETDGVVIPEFKKKEWSRMSQVILDAVVERVNESDDEVAELWALFEDLLSCRRRYLVEVEIKSRSDGSSLRFNKDIGTNAIGYSGEGTLYVSKGMLLQHAVAGGFEINRKSLTRMAMRAGWKDVRVFSGNERNRVFEVTAPWLGPKNHGNAEEKQESEKGHVEITANLPDSNAL